MPKLLKIFSILLLFTILWPASALAIVTVKDLGGPLFLSINPNNPKLGDEVTITLSSFTSNINKNKITWGVNEELLLEGIGEKTFSLVIASTSPTRITVSTDDFDGRPATREIVIEPGDMHLIWETDSFSPFFYDGKSLPSIGSTIRLKAFPDIYYGGAKVPNEMIYFNWTYNNNDLADQSGWGRDSASIAVTDSSRSNIISLRISDPDKEVTYRTASIVIPTRQPEFIFYPADPISGLFYPKGYSTTINDVKNEITAVPFNLGVPLDFISYDWTSVGVTSSQQEGPTVDLSYFLTNNEINKNITFTATALNNEFLPLRSFLRIGLE